MVSGNNVVMSLINQMLRDLEKRNSTNNTPPLLQHNIQVTHSPRSKFPLLLWGTFGLAITAGTYWAYQNSQTLNKTQPLAVADNTKIAPTPAPIAPYEKVLSTPNAIINNVLINEQKQLDNSAEKLSLKEPDSMAHAGVTETTVPKLQPVTSTVPVQATSQSASSVPEIASEQSPPKSPVAPRVMPVKQTNRQTVDALYNQAENNPGDLSAIYKLEQALKLDPRHLKARLLLAKTLYNQGQAIKTAEFLDQSLALFPDNLQFINTRAQLFLKQKDPNGALRTLQRVGLENSSNETYLSLLAATYQQLQSFTNAAKVYQKLVAVNPEKAENWLGLALSQEKLGNSKLAHDAYQQALNKNTLKASVADYVKQRITELR
ncbi:MAG: tetratricopeptide repeat protein [Methylobacter sp.]